MRPGILIGVLIVLLVLSGSMFTVNEAQHAVTFRFGKVLKADFQPGLHFKFPGVDNVRKFDRFIISLESQPERFLTKEKKDVIVDSVVKWRITEPAKFFTAAADNEGAAQRLIPIIKDGLRNEINKRNLQDVVAGERGNMMAAFTKAANEKAKELGVEIVDVRIKRINLPDEVSGSVYLRMQAERQRVANELRSQGTEKAERIRSAADREVQVILAEAESKGQILRGEGDAIAAKTFADAFNKDPEFYSFYRSLQAYRDTFQGQNDMLVLDPNSEFFKYFKNDQIR